MQDMTTTQTTPHSIADDRVITLDEAAVIAGVSSSTLKRANKRGTIKFVRPSPRRVGVRRSELQRWLDACSA
jgi:excisionase family DNA binding protein